MRYLVILLSIGFAVPASAQDAEAEAPPEETTEEAAPAVEDASVEPDGEALTEPAADAEPSADTESEGESEAEAPAEAPPPPAGPELTFANSYFSWGHYVTAWTFAPGAGLTYNPTYFQTFSLNPRFYLTNTTFLWLNQGMSIELTDSDDGTYNREPMLDDTFLDLRQNIPWEGFVFQAAARLAFPLSKASQAAQRVMQTGLALTVTRPFPEAANFTIAANFAYRHWWALSNVAMARASSSTPGYCNPASFGSTNEPCVQAGGPTTLRDLLVAGLTLSVAPVPELSIVLQGIWVSAYAHELAPGTVAINGGEITLEDESLTHWRNFTYLMLAVAYDVQPWLNLQLGISNSGVMAPLYSPDGSVRGPFNSDTQIFLSATLTLDTIYQGLFGASEDEGLTPEERQRRRQGLAHNGGTSAF